MQTRTSENSSGQQFFYYKCRHTFCSGRYHKTVQKNQDVDYVIAEELTSPHDPECDPADFAKKERIKKFKSQLFSKVVDYKATLGAAYGTTVNELIVDLTGNENQQDYCRLLTS